MKIIITTSLNSGKLYAVILQFFNSLFMDYDNVPLVSNRPQSILDIAAINK
jgi:hypothetical protein